MKVAVLTPIPTPYRDAFWNAFQQLEEVDLQVYYCAEGKPDRPWSRDWEWQYEGLVLPGRNWALTRKKDASLYWNPRVMKLLRTHRPDALLLGGYNHPTMWAAWWQARSLKIPMYMMCETHRLPRGGLKDRIRTTVVKTFIKSMTGGLPTGMAASKYLTYFGLPVARQARLPNVPDIATIRERVERVPASVGDTGSSQKPTILFAGRLITKKGLPVLLEAAGKFVQQYDFEIVIAGDGPDRQALEELVKVLGLEARVRLLGFIQPEELREWYSRAHVFVLPSHETWGVAAVEAASAGLTVLLSDHVGCADDLSEIYPDVHTFRYGSLEDLADRLEHCLESGVLPGVEKSVKLEEAWSHNALARKLFAFLKRGTS